MDDPELPLLLQNPSCSRSREARALLVERGVAFRERRYLDDPLSRAELEQLAARLGRPVREWVRRREQEYAAAGLSDRSDAAALLDAIAAHPRLLERPILVHGERAVVGRPPEAVLTLLDR
jgi:arsenate reductase